MQVIRSTRSVRLAIPVALVIAAAAGPARAQSFDTGNSSIFDTLTSLVGLSSGRAEPVIDYRERAPLVVPPRIELPQPMPAGANRAANWPVDANLTRPQGMTDRDLRRFGGGEDAKLSKQELMAGRAVSGQPAGPRPMEDGCMSVGPTGDCLYFSPDKLRAGNPRLRRDELVVGEEPARNYLTQPPSGYRRATAQTGTGPRTEQLSAEQQASPYAFFRNLNPFRKNEDEE